MSAATLDHANLYRADLGGAQLRETLLRYADVSEANLRGANLTFADLREASMRGTDLALAKLIETNLTRADLDEANFFGADLNEADLTGASLRGADFLEAENLDRARFHGATFSATTNWPEGFDAGTAGALPEDQSSSKRKRVDSMSGLAQTRVRQELEPIVGHLERVRLDDEDISAQDDEYLRSQLQTIQVQLRLESDGDTRIVELALANITRRFADRLLLQTEARAALAAIGIPEELIDRSLDGLNAQLAAVGNLGQDDAERDGAAVAGIAKSVTRIEGALDRIENEASEAFKAKGGHAGGFLVGVASSLMATGVMATWQGITVRLLVAMKNLLGWLTSLV